jgi:hypothetical protein
MPHDPQRAAGQSISLVPSKRLGSFDEGDAGVSRTTVGVWRRWSSTVKKPLVKERVLGSKENSPLGVPPSGGKDRLKPVLQTSAPDDANEGPQGCKRRATRMHIMADHAAHEASQGSTRKTIKMHT